jgi:hypothetical protein
VPNTLHEAETQLNAIIQIRNRTARRIVPSRGWKKVAKKVYRAFARLRWGDEPRFSRVDSLAQEYPFTGSEYCRDAVWTPYPDSRYLTADFDQLTRISFCGKEFSCVPHWDAALRSMYGDYMVVPSKKHQVTHKAIAWRL